MGRHRRPALWRYVSSLPEDDQAHLSSKGLVARCQNISQVQRQTATLASLTQSFLWRYIPAHNARLVFCPHKFAGRNLEETHHQNRKKLAFFQNVLAI